MLRHHCLPRFPGPSCWGRLPARPCPEGPPPTRSVRPSPCDSVALGPGVSRLLTQNKFTDFGPRLGLLEQEQPRSPENLRRQLRHRPLPPGLMSSQAVPSLPLAKSTVGKPLCEALRVLLLGVISFLSPQGSSLKGTAGRLPGFPPGLEIWLTNDFTGKVEAGPGPPHGSRLSLGSLLWASCTVGHRPADAGQSLVSGQAGETDRGPRHATNKLRFLEKQSFGGVCVLTCNGRGQCFRGSTRPCGLVSQPPHESTLTLSKASFTPRHPVAVTPCSPPSSVPGGEFSAVTSGQRTQAGP